MLFEVTEVFRQAFVSKIFGPPERLVLLLVIIERHAKRMMDVVNFADEIGDGQLQPVCLEPSGFVLRRQPKPAAEIEQDIGDMGDDDIAVLQEGRCEGRESRRLVFHHRHHPPHAAVRAGDVDVVGTRLLQRETNELAAAWNAIPIKELIGHGKTFRA